MEPDDLAVSLSLSLAATVLFAFFVSWKRAESNDEWMVMWSAQTGCIGTIGMLAFLIGWGPLGLRFASEISCCCAIIMAFYWLEHWLFFPKGNVEKGIVVWVLLGLIAVGFTAAERIRQKLSKPTTSVEEARPHEAANRTNH